ncbi:MAG TPA: site-specific integrase [Solirubrobacterales bacterium]|nr:site-specific integrase [Solirubrobacterales bacterium]
MGQDNGQRRAYGSGSLYPHRGSWYAKWYVGNRQVKRKIGRLRKRGSREGLTKAQAEKEMRRLMREVKATPQERLTLREVGDAYIAHVRDFLERKPSTVQDYEGILNKAERGLPMKTINRYGGADIEGYVSTMKKAGRSSKTINNHLNFLHGLFAFGEKRGWASGNAVAEAERPRADGSDPDIRFIDLEELEALLREVPDDVLGAVERPLYLTAAMTGLRQGELIALRWKDVDWKAGLIRVRRNYTRGRFGTPKTKRSSRSVPMPERVAAALKEHSKRSNYTGADDLVFCHPETGNPFDASKMRKRFKVAIEAAGVRSIRLHDLRHTFGTKMAAAGAPLRTIQEWMGHRDYKTTEIYADYAPDPVQGARWAEAAFADEETEGDTSATDDENEAS